LDFNTTEGDIRLNGCEDNDMTGKQMSNSNVTGTANMTAGSNNNNNTNTTNETSGTANMTAGSNNNNTNTTNETPELGETGDILSDLNLTP
jgi:hypothetical protein